MSVATRGAAFWLAAALASVLTAVSPARADPAASGATPTPLIPELVVTGTHIRTAGLTSVSPLAIVERAKIAAEGLPRLEDVITRLPQAYAGQNANVTNAATGTATVDLRQLGPERTLVLLDGKRLMPGDPTAGSTAPDLNFIPSSLIDRVEVATGGASAVYGSDAIAGVVNFITLKDFSGLRLDALAGGHDHTNGDEAVQAIVAGQGYALPSHHVDDGLTWDLNLTFGVDTPDRKGNLTVYGGYRQAQAIVENARDYSACALLGSGTTRVCQGSSSSPANGLFVVLDPSFNPVAALTLDPNGPGDALRPFDDVRDSYNFAAYEYFQRPDARWVGGGFAHYQASAGADVYVQGMFMDDRSTAQLAPSGLFADSPTFLSCANPLLSAAEVQAFCTDAGVPPGGQAVIVIGKRNVEGGPRQYSLGHRDYRILGGVKGELGAWTYDLSAQYAAVRADQEVVNDVSLSRAADALDVVQNASGQLVCASGNPGCAPYDLFKIGGVSKAALDYISVPASSAGSTSETVLGALLTGQLDRYGLKSPWAARGLGVALGLEYRRESLAYSPDAVLASGDLASSGEAEPPVSGAFHVFEAYGELRVPIADDPAPWLHQVLAEAGVRYSRYNAAGGVWTFKAGGEVAPTADLRLRAGFNHAVRAPNAIDLYTPQTVALGLETDPCAGADPLSANGFATAANCARTGVSAAQYGRIADNPTGYNALIGGNPDAKPEAADTVTVGAVVTPRPLPGFSLTVDYFDIEVKGELGQLGADLTLEQCLKTGEPLFCNLVHRDPNTGSLWLGPHGYVIDITQNIASMRAQGVDVQANYRRDLPRVADRDVGGLTFDLAGSYVTSHSTRTIPGGAAYDCAGLYGPICGQPLPRWRHVLTTTWLTPWRVDVAATWRYVVPVKLDFSSSNPVLSQPYDPVDARLGAQSYFDLALTWRVDRVFTLRAGANNLFDRDPPLFGFAGAFGNGNSYPGVYDVLGRYLFVGLTARL